MTPVDKARLENILTTAMALVKNIELYPETHPSVQKPLTNCYEALARELRTEGMLSLGMVDEVLVFAGVPFYSNQMAVQELQKRLEDREVSGIEIHDGLEREEFFRFIKMLTEDPGRVKSEGHLSDALRSRRIHHVVAKDAKEVYNRAVDAVGEVLQQARMGRIPRAGKAKNAAEDLKRMVLTDRSAIMALTLIKSYDNYLFNHSVNVSVLAIALAQGLDVPEDDFSDIGLAGLLHDIGKTLTPKSIIQKCGGLSDEEWRVMREHPSKSYEIVRQMDGVSDLVARIVKEHHVHFDRKGYPSLEPGEHPHPYSRIVSVADVYDAITTLRPYQKPYQPREAMKIMERLAGKVIDPKYFEEFVKVLGIFPVGSLVRLDTNEVAVVTESCAEMPMNPRVRIMFDPEGKPLIRPIEMDLSKQEEGERRSIVSTVDPLLYNVDITALL